MRDTFLTVPSGLSFWAPAAPICRLPRKRFAEFAFEPAAENQLHRKHIWAFGLNSVVAATVAGGGGSKCITRNRPQLLFHAISFTRFRQKAVVSVGLYRPAWVRIAWQARVTFGFMERDLSAKRVSLVVWTHCASIVKAQSPDIYLGKNGLPRGNLPSHPWETHNWS